jgi:hypothetical protein
MVRNPSLCSIRSSSVVPLLALAFAPVYSQERSGGPIALVAAAMTRLAPLTGAWDGEAVLRATQWTEGSKSALQATFLPILDKNHLDGTLRYVIAGKPFEARVIFSYDFQTKQYRAFWIDTLGSPPLVFNGTFANAQTLVLNASRKMAAQVVKEKLRLTFITSGEWELASSSDASGDMIEQAVLHGRTRKK